MLQRRQARRGRPDMTGDASKWAGNAVEEENCELGTTRTQSPAC